MSVSTGLLAVSSLLELSVYTLSLEDDLPTWTNKWSIAYVYVYVEYYVSSTHA